MELTSGTDLREQAERLKLASIKLMEAAEILDGIPARNGAGMRGQFEKKVFVPSSSKPHKKTGTRVAQLKKFLAEVGPSSRKAIMEALKVPIGTLSYILKDENGFAKDENGLWTIKQ